MVFMFTVFFFKQTDSLAFVLVRKNEKNVD